MPGDGSAGAAVPGADGTPGARSPIRAGRNLPAALGVGLLLGGLAIVTLILKTLLEWRFSDELAAHRRH